MLYAKIILGLPVEGPFDYIVPDDLSKKIKPGMRVKIPFSNRLMVGYVVGLTKKTHIKKLKLVLELIDTRPILDKNMLLLAKKISDYYCCSWGQALETAIPRALRKAKALPASTKDNLGNSIHSEFKKEIVLIHDLDHRRRWDIYLKEIEAALSKDRTALIILPDIDSIFKAKQVIEARFSCPTGILYREEPEEINEWLRIRNGEVKIVIGSRSAIFAPLKNPGLIIIEEEQYPYYKQDQVPHYHVRDAAFMRLEIEHAKLILGSSNPSLETFYLAKTKKIEYIYMPPDKFPEIKIIDMNVFLSMAKYKKAVFSKYLEDSISSTLNSGGKALLFLNRKGFATFASCRQCSHILKCPRCNINLVYHFRENTLSCHYCNFKMPPPPICPKCNAGYIRYSGLGTEKMESELARLFPQAKIERIDSTEKGGQSAKQADILVSTSLIFKGSEYKFGLVGVIAIDNSLNHLDLRSSEKTFGLLANLLNLAQEKLVIQTHIPGHHCFGALVNKNIGLFYERELEQRKELKFPPYRHLGMIKLRGKKEMRVKETAQVIFERLNKYNKDKDINIISVNPAQPPKLRGNFCWQILIQAKSPIRLTGFLKRYLKGSPHSGIIVTVDIDPV